MFSQPGDLNAWFRHYPHRHRPPVVLDQLIQERGSSDKFASEWRTVHRLDACVTGGMLIARNKNAAIQFSKNLRKGGYKGFKLTRRYVALVNGKIAEKYLPDEGLISCLGMTSKYKRFDENCMVLELVTGGKRQIRRHMSEAVGTPILNDAKFGGLQIVEANPEQIALHSASIHTMIGLQTRKHLIPMIYNNNGVLWDSKYLHKDGTFIEEIRKVLLEEWNSI